MLTFHSTTHPCGASGLEREAMTLMGFMKLQPIVINVLMQGNAKMEKL